MSRFAFRTSCLVLLALAMVLPASVARAGTTGKLTGRVVGDKKEPLPGVNIRVEGQRLGAVTDDDGRYFIIGIPAGVYTVQANLLGYAAYAAHDVTIAPDFSTTLDIQMKPEAVQMAEVRVEAERPLLQKDATGTTRFLSSDDIQKLPTRGYRDAAAQQTGVVNFKRQIDNETQNSNTLIVRGGRPNETAYYVDGFSQQDPLTGTSSTSISNNAIQEVVVLTGGFNAEYGRIMSGAVNVVTREGADKYFGAIEAVSDVLAGNWVGADRTDYNVYDASLGGPLFPTLKNITFYASGERRWQGDRNPSFLSSDFKSALSSLGLSSDVKPNDSSGGYTFQGKIAWQFNNQVKLKVGGLGSEDNWREYRHAYLFDLAHSPRYLDRNQSYYATVNHVLSPKTFYEVGGTYFETLRKLGDGVAFDNLNGYYPAAYGGVNPLFDTTVPLFYLPGHVFDDYLQRKSQYWGLQGNITSQFNRYNQLKAGADYLDYTLRYFEHFFPVELGGANPNVTDYDNYGYALTRDKNGNWVLNESDNGQDGAKHPKTWSMYVQDKFEREGVILNGGLRFDHINVDTQALRSEQFPLGDPSDPNNLPDSLEAKDLQSNKTYSRISPRFGVAFPVDEKTILRFNYGQFYQQPNLQDLFVSYRFLQHKIQTGGYFVGFGNPNLKPERTTAYEVGAARQMGDNVRLDLTAYYKDVKDLVEIVTIPSFPNLFSSYRNVDFATIKGVDVGFTMRKTHNISTSLNYSLSFAQGTGSVSNTQRNIAWTGSQPPKQTAPLDFDQRHKISANFDLSLGKGEGPMMNKRHWFENTDVNVLFNVASGTPYTPTNVFNEVTLAAVSSQPSGPLNSRYGPWTSQLDIKASKGFHMGAMQLEGFVWGLNVFDSKNPIAVYNSTGSPNTTGWLNTDEGQNFLQSAATAGKDGAALYRLAENNPNLYSNPRLVRFGISTSF
jgi:outer membrane receptor protein involved in Fe transport